MLVGAAVALTALLALAAPAGAQQEDGERIYRRICASCHGDSGAGNPGVFPPLAGNPNVSDGAYLREVIANGRSGQIVVNGVTYDGVMPANLAAGLADAEIDALVAYVQGDLQTVVEVTTTTLPPVAIAPIAEGAVLGRRLFLGQASFDAGGPACAACHAAGEHGDLVDLDAGFGPDLTDAWSALGGAEGVVEALRSPHAGAMAAPYADTPLTPEEIGAVAAYLEVAGDQSSASVFDGLVLIALAVLGLLVATTAMVVAGRRDRSEAAP
jgi:mono/diheme cytochrome c family protein